MNFRKNIAIYLSSNILNAAIPFILLPVLTRYLSPSEYGQIAMFQSLVVGFGAFIGVNTVGAANRKFYDDNHTPQKLKEFNGACFQILCCTLLVAVVLVMLIENVLTDYLMIPSVWLYLSLFLSSLTFLITFRLGQWQIRHSPKKYAALQIGNSVINMSLALFFIIILNAGMQGRVDSLLYASIVSAIVAALSLYKDDLICLNKVNKEYVKEALAFGVPLIPHIFGAFLLTTADRFIINDKLGVADTGVYMVAVQVSMAFIIVFDAINKAYVPWLFGKLKRGEEKDKALIVRNTYVYFVFVLILAGLSFLVGPYFIVTVVGSEYEEAGKFIGWLCLGQVFGGMYLMVTNYIFYTRNTGKLSMITIICGLLNILLLIIFVGDFGIKGGAMVFALSKFFQFIFTWRLAMKCIAMPWFSMGKS